MSTHASRPERLTFFSDTAFAIAITLLVIEIHVLRLGTADDYAYLLALHELLPSILGFVPSLPVIGALWAAHHRVFGLLADYDSGLVMPNLLLMAIAFMPFATALMSANPLAWVAPAYNNFVLLLIPLLARMFPRPARRRLKAATA
jgi:uncharacterized membrane protein